MAQGVGGRAIQHPVVAHAQPAEPVALLVVASPARPVGPADQRLHPARVAPETTRSLTKRMSSECTAWNPTRQNCPLPVMTSMRRSTSWTVGAAGFSRCTGKPARKAAVASASWVVGPVAM